MTPTPAQIEPHKSRRRRGSSRQGGEGREEEGKGGRKGREKGGGREGKGRGGTGGGGGEIIPLGEFGDECLAVSLAVSRTSQVTALQDHFRIHDTLNLLLGVFFLGKSDVS